MSDNIKVVYKKCGETPLDCINNIKNDDRSLMFLPMTYAGRLDPLAEGVLIILIGDETHKKDEYLNLPKEYEVDLLFGFATDTYDVMGRVNDIKEAETKKLLEMVWPSFQENLARRSEDLSNSFFVEALKNTISNFIGKIKQSYPPYSSRPVKGKPLFMWAREGKLAEIDIPEHDVFVESIEIIKEDFIDSEKLLEKIKNDIGKVKGDFRQKEILDLWEEKLKDKKEEKYKIIRLRISCGSGVYVRGIANDIGRNLGIPALALSIIRTKVGEYITKT